jgi:hypothetical protein
MFVLNDRRLGVRKQNIRIDLVIELNFMNPDKDPLPLAELQRRIEENEYRKRQLVNVPLNQRQLDKFHSLWNIFLYYNPSKRPPNYKPKRPDIFYENIYNGPREIPKDRGDSEIKKDKRKQLAAYYFWNPSKRPEGYNGHLAYSDNSGYSQTYILENYDMNYHGPREITYKYTDWIVKPKHAAYVRAKKYLSEK